MYRHLDIAFAAGRHERFKEVPEVLPELFLGDILVGVEKFGQVSHSLRLPARHGKALTFFEDVLCHLLRVIYNLVLLIVEGC